MRLRVDLELCAGHGRCYVLAPEIFDEDERGRCRLLLESVPSELEARARRAAGNCPEDAIEVEDG